MFISPEIKQIAKEKLLPSYSEGHILDEIYY